MLINNSLILSLSHISDILFGKSELRKPANEILILHFNDVYNCETPKKAKAGGAPRFVSALLDKGFARSPTRTAVIEGHADERGTREYNLALGARRAASARDFLVACGVAANCIRTISYGKERPEAPCSAESCWSLNRRGVTVMTDGPTS